MAKTRKFAKNGSNTKGANKTALKVANKRQNQLIKRGVVKPKTKSRYEAAKERKKNVKDASNRRFHQTDDGFGGEEMMEMMSEKDLKRMKRKAEIDSSDEEKYGSGDEVEDYEKRGARDTFEKKQRKEGSNSSNGGDSTNNQTNGHGNEEPEEPPRQLTLVELMLQKKTRFQEIKDQVGTIATSIITYPERNLPKMKTLLVLLDFKDSDPAFRLAFPSVQKLIAYALLEVFKDILPSYRLKENFSDETAKDRKSRLKAETKQLRDYEMMLIKFYKVYIHRMERMIDCTKNPKKRSSVFYQSMLSTRSAKERMAEVGAKCVTRLLVSHPNFNFRDNLIQIVVPLMVSKNKEIAKLGANAAISLYKQDKLGDVSLAVVKATSKLVKAFGLRTEPLVLQTFLSLKVKEVKRKVDEKDMKKIRDKLDKMSRKDKKRNKKMQKLENQLLETEAQESQKKKLDFHTEILSQLFFTYFRLLKNVAENGCDEERKESTRCLTPVLDGLSKYCHMINVDFYDDLVALLYRLLISGTLNNSQALCCLHTVFTILSDDGFALNIDPQRFYAQLYQCMLSLDVEDSRADSDIRLLHVSFDKMILKKRKQMTITRVLAFAKRLSTVALQAPNTASASLLGSLRILMSNHTQCDVLMDTETFGSGLFLPEILDPEYSNANASRLWELHLLRKHCDAVTRRFAFYILNGLKSNDLKVDFIKKTPIDICDNAFQCDDEFINSTNVPEVYGKRKFHGYTLSSDSLASKFAKMVELE